MLLPIVLAATVVSQCLPSAATPKDGGQHLRWESSRGPVHAWCRDGVQKPELLVVYVHGHFDTVDDAARDHGLFPQFAKSEADALFVMIEAPTNKFQPVNWTSFESLRTEVATKLGVTLPERAVILSHSGGNRTLRSWLGEDAVRDVVLLDSFYGPETPWGRWLEHNQSAKLQLVDTLTHAKAERWRKTLRVSVSARVTQQKAGTDHMGVITDGVWIPKVVAERAGQLATR